MKVDTYRKLIRPLMRRLRRDCEELPVKPARIWFHASSAGELEILWPFLEEGMKRGIPLRLTLFSPSTKSLHEKLRAKLPGLDLGFSPGEGDWGRALTLVKPELFVSAKYEAWPELWISLERLRIPLLILGAMDRSSLKWADRISRIFGKGPPKLYFSCADSSDESALKFRFPHSTFLSPGDPRWDRVKERLAKPHARVETLVKNLTWLPRPWGVMGSVHPEDLEQWIPILSKYREGARLWVPHSLLPDQIEKISSQIERITGKKPLRTSSLQTDGNNPPLPDTEVVVDEAGFLTELYGVADWAYVGGGFGKGIHSTLEPACSLIPIAAGPKNATRFPETRWLVSQKILTIVRDGTELGTWYSRLSRDKKKESHWSQWSRALETRFGAAKELSESIFTLERE